MAKENYMALADFQTLWTNKIKPSIVNTYAKKDDVPTVQVASSDTCMDIIDELT